MEISNVQLFIDHIDGESESFFQWKTYVEKYLVYGLEQRGIKVKIADSYNNYSYTSNFIFLYLPIFTSKSISSLIFKDRIKEISLATGELTINTIGLIKEKDVTEKSITLFPEMTFLNTFLIDKDTGEEITDIDLLKQDFLHLFLFRIIDLCNLIEQQLKVGSQIEDSENYNAVYLAEASKDQEEVRNEVKRELLRRGYVVYPEKKILGTSKEIEKQINELLLKCKLSIHIFGKLLTEETTGIAGLELENKVAANFFTTKIKNKKIKNSFSRIIWQPDNLIVIDEKQKKFLSQIYKDSKLYAGAEIISSSIEELKDIILDKLTIKPNSFDDGENGSSSEIKSNKSVYIVISDKNKEKLTTLTQMVESFGYDVRTKNDLCIAGKDYLKNCDSVLFYYEEENTSWLRSKVGEVYKYKNWEYSGTFERKGIITLNNQELPQGDIFKEFTHIKVQHQFDQGNFSTFFFNSISK